ncbi:hypothetical protein IF2G_05881 [Cordyceps javanica]|nr:hypothetical protein IF2G_05881 [Cordyceps javanica]
MEEDDSQGVKCVSACEVDNDSRLHLRPPILFVSSKHEDFQKRPDSGPKQIECRRLFREPADTGG